MSNLEAVHNRQGPTDTHVHRLATFSNKHMHQLETTANPCNTMTS